MWHFMKKVLFAMTILSVAKEKIRTNTTATSGVNKTLMP
jgi:hypothetical protein